MAVPSSSPTTRQLWKDCQETSNPGNLIRRLLAERWKDLLVLPIKRRVPTSNGFLGTTDWSYRNISLNFKSEHFSSLQSILQSDSEILFPAGHFYHRSGFIIGFPAQSWKSVTPRFRIWCYCPLDFVLLFELIWKFETPICRLSKGCQQLSKLIREGPKEESDLLILEQLLSKDFAISPEPNNLPTVSSDLSSSSESSSGSDKKPRSSIRSRALAIEDPSLMQNSLTRSADSIMSRPSKELTPDPEILLFIGKTNGLRRVQSSLNPNSLEFRSSSSDLGENN